jgi:hypothetical protein
MVPGPRKERKMEVTNIKKVPLPATVEDMLARKSPTLQNLNDHVDSIHVALFAANERYQKLLDAVHDEEAEEGSLSADNLLAAMMIREYAQKNDNPYVARKKLATIVKSLNVVLRRYHMSRKERAQSIHGEPVSGE